MHLLKCIRGLYRPTRRRRRSRASLRSQCALVGFRRASGHITFRDNACVTDMELIRYGRKECDVSSICWCGRGPEDCAFAQARGLRPVLQLQGREGSVVIVYLCFTHHFRREMHANAQCCSRMRSWRRHEGSETLRLRASTVYLVRSAVSPLCSNSSSPSPTFMASRSRDNSPVSVVLSSDRKIILMVSLQHSGAD